MLGLDDSPEIRGLVDDAIRVFGDEIEPMLAGLIAEIDEEILQLLTQKISVLMLHDRVNDNPDVPYVTIWQSGQTGITQVYMSPKLSKLLGYSPSELGGISYGELVGDKIISYFEEQHEFREETLQKDAARTAREEEYLGNRQWEGFYQIKKKDGTFIWVMDRSTLTGYINTKRDNVVYVSEGILLESTEMMARGQK
jgi:hypothetical protein